MPYEERRTIRMLVEPDFDPKMTRFPSVLTMMSYQTSLELESRYTKLCFLLFGIGSVVPQRAITASLDFFETEYYPYEPQFSFNLAISLPTFLMQLFLFIYL